MKDSAALAPDESAIHVNLKEQTGQVLRTLTPREEKITNMRFGVEDDSEHTLEEVGTVVRRHPGTHSPDRSQGPAQLRQPAGAGKLRLFLDDTHE